MYIKSYHYIVFCMFLFLNILQTNNFIGLPWCDFCGNFMWGLIAQGVKCEGMFDNSFNNVFICIYLYLIILPNYVMLYTK